MNFFITGMGRSGSKFLARYLNTDANWTVKHEAPPHDYSSVLRRLESLPNYGEVNTCSLDYGPPNLFLPLDYRIGILIRNPLENLSSMVSRHPELGFDKCLSAIFKKALIISDSTPDIFISFSKMTSDPDYLGEIGGFFNVSVEIKDSLQIINKNTIPNHVFSSSEREAAKKRLGWFVDEFSQRGLL